MMRHEPAGDITGQVDDYMRARVELEHFSGAICLARGGEPLISKGYGLANREHDVPNSPLTKFRLASLTKQFTATAIMLLQQQGQLQAHDPVRMYLDGCPAAWDMITIHHLLSHTSGIPNHTDFPETWATIGLPRTVAELIASFKDRPLDFAPGQRWNYSNSGYILLGAIIEQVAEQSYEQFMRERIFEPLGMFDSGYDRASPIVPRRASGYLRHDGAIVNAAYIDMSIPYAAGALYSTVGDLYLWDQALSTERLITHQLLDVMYTPAPIAAPPGYVDYGYGWAIYRTFKRDCVGHSGGIFGFSTQLLRFLDDRMLIIVLSNLESPYIAAISRDLRAIVSGAPYSLPQSRQAIALDPQIYAAYTGEYSFDDGDRTIRVTVSRDGDRLLARIAGDPVFELLPLSELEFFVETNDDRYTFGVDPYGQAAYVVIDMAGRLTRATRIREQL
jgi:CubicO group peptidase (beta-lactamase class C family)